MALAEYVTKLVEKAAVNGASRCFDEEVIDELIFETPRPVQEAVLWNARHCGRRHVWYPDSILVPRSAGFAQESLGDAAVESSSYEGLLRSQPLSRCLAFGGVSAAGLRVWSVLSLGPRFS